jgi:protein-disulfide isomerase
MSKKQRDTNRTARAAAVRREQASRERNRRILLTVVVLVVLAVIVTAGVLIGSSGSSPSQAGASASASKVDARADGQALVIGTNPDAPKVVVYEDFLCPYCREFESASRSTLRDAAEKGKVVVEYRPFHLLQDDYSTEALTAWAGVLQKGTPAQALKFHDLLYENQPYESDTNKPGLDDLVKLDEKAGVSKSSVTDAMRQDNTAFVDAADAAATKADVQGTPTVLFDGKPLVGSPTQLADTVKQRLGL